MLKKTVPIVVAFLLVGCGGKKSNTNAMPAQGAGMSADTSQMGDSGMMSDTSHMGGSMQADSSGMGGGMKADTGGMKHD